MAIDSSLFMVDLPAGTYSVGDVVELRNVAGPAVVRSGRGVANLKRLTTGIIGSANGSITYWEINLKNSDWIDPMTSLSGQLRSNTALDERSGSIQRGNDCPLTPNSSWTVTARCIGGSTTTIANTIFALIDIDYPSVASIVDPDSLPGIPTSIDYTPAAAITENALGAGLSANWDTFNVDIFKAGYEYALQKIEMMSSPTLCGFMALSNAAGMGGLQRILPTVGLLEAIKNKVEYATKLVKGPMDVKFMMFNNTGTAGTQTPLVIFDFVKRRV